MSHIDGFLTHLLQQGGSDLHLASGAMPIARIHGTLQPMGTDAVDLSTVHYCLSEMITDGSLEHLPTVKNMDFVYETTIGSERCRFRGNVYYQKNGLNIVMRYVPRKLPSPEVLGLPPDILRFADLHQGLVLVTGPAGCGKTTTLAAMVRYINSFKKLHVITIEDPIEYLHESQMSLINQRQVGLHVDSFPTALLGALREDPDVILVGELRDLETTQLAITAAETGHLVLSSMHTNTAAKTIDRLVDAFPVDQQSQVRTMVSESLKGVITQQLIPRADGKGRALALEVMVVTPSVANLIRDNKTHQIANTVMSTRQQGMRLMDHSIAGLLNAGIISQEEANRRIVDKRVLMEGSLLSGPSGRLRGT